MTRPSPVYNSDNIHEIDILAQKFTSENNWGMGAFITVFDPTIENVLLVKLGEYAKDESGGMPWTLPGGAVEPGETPSHATIRELIEETGLLNPSDLQVAAWLKRPYFKTRQYESAGELILLFVGIDRTCANGLRPAPPEVIDCGFHHFNLEDWLQVPARGNGTHHLAPIPRHWIYWILMAQKIVKNPGSPIFTHEYENPASMAIIPSSLKTKF